MGGTGCDGGIRELHSCTGQNKSWSQAVGGTAHGWAVYSNGTKPHNERKGLMLQLCFLL